MEIKTNIVYKHLLQSDKKIIIEQGGTRSGKTYNILLWIIFDYCHNNTNKIITICRKSYPALRATVMRDFLDILIKSELYDEALHNKTNSEYRIDSNIIEFVSLDQPQKLRGRKRNLLFCNEINEISKEDWNQLIFRTDGRIIGDFNPSDTFSFIYDDIITRDDCDFFKTTYKDNPFLEQSIQDEIERLKDTDEEYWMIYGLGERAMAKSIVFRHTEFNQVPEDAKLLGFGMDYGYNDPTCLVSLHQKDFDLYITELFYRSLMTGADIHNKLKELQLEGKPIYADTNEPRMTEFLRSSGHRVIPAIKGKDSVNASIDLLKRYKLYVKGDNAIREFRNYKWKKDRQGRITNVPEHDFSHSIDASRYIAFAMLGKPNFGRYAIR